MWHAVSVQAVEMTTTCCRHGQGHELHKDITFVALATFVVVVALLFAATGPPRRVVDAQLGLQRIA